MYAFLNASMCATCPAHLTFHDLINFTILIKSIPFTLLWSVELTRSYVSILCFQLLPWPLSKPFPLFQIPSLLLFSSSFSSTFSFSIPKACVCVAKESFLSVYLIHFHFWSLICTATGFPCASLHSVFKPGHRVNIMQPISMQFSIVRCYTFSSSLSWVAQNFILGHLQLCFCRRVWDQVRYPCNGTGKIINLPYETVRLLGASLLKQSSDHDLSSGVCVSYLLPDYTDF